MGRKLSTAVSCALALALIGAPDASRAGSGWGGHQWQKRCARIRTSYNSDRPLDRDSLTLGVYDPRWEDFVFWAVINGISDRRVDGPAGSRAAGGIKLRWAEGTRWERTVEYSYGYALALLVGEHGWRDVQFADYFSRLGGTYDYNIKDRLYLIEPSKPDAWIEFFRYLGDRDGQAFSYALARPVLIDVDRERVIYRGGQGVSYEVSYERFLADLRGVLDDCRAYEFFEAYDTYGQGFASRAGWSRGRASAREKLAFRVGGAGAPDKRLEPSRPPAEKSVEVTCEDRRAVKIYRDQCAVCHGSGGRGDGRMAASLVPPPRDLTRGRFKIRSTQPGSLPRDEDLVGIVSQGLPGSAMPGWSQFLDPGEIERVVACVKQLSPRFASEPMPPPLPVKPPRMPVGETLFNGAKQWRRLGCQDCHGGDGRGWGPRALDLKDYAGRPVLPTDLSNKWQFRGGHSPAEVYLRLAAGMDGTPMPSYLGAASERNLWDLVFYVLDLSPQRRPQVSRRASDTAP